MFPFLFYSDGRECYGRSASCEFFYFFRRKFFVFVDEFLRRNSVLPTVSFTTTELTQQRNATATQHERGWKQ